MTKNHGFVGKSSVLSNLRQFLQDIHRALDNNSNQLVETNYVDFSEAFDRVPHQLQQKFGKIGVGRVLFDNL